MYIQVNIDKESLNAMKLSLAEMEGIAGKVQSRAINKSLVTVRAAGVDLLYLELNLRKADIRAAFTVLNATYSKPAGTLLAVSKPVPLIDFVGTRAMARGGVNVQVKRSGPKTLLKHAFIATMKSGHQGVFERQGGNMGRRFNILKNYAALPKQYRLPIDEMFSLRITDEYGKPEVLAKVLVNAGEVYLKNYEHELDYELSRAK